MSGRQRISAATRRYARALFEASLERGELERVAADIGLLGQALADSSVGRWLADPRVEDARKQELIEREFAVYVTPLTQSFLRVLAARRRHALLTELPAAFEEQLDQHQGRIRGVVECPGHLREDQVRAIETGLSARTGKSVSLESRMEPSLLGGVRVTLDGVRYDGSLRGRLEAARRSLSLAELGGR